MGVEAGPGHSPEHPSRVSLLKTSVLCPATWPAPSQPPPEPKSHSPGLRDGICTSRCSLLATRGARRQQGERSSRGVGFLQVQVWILKAEWRNVSLQQRRRHCQGNIPQPRREPGPSSRRLSTKALVPRGGRTRGVSSGFVAVPERGGPGAPEAAGTQPGQPGPRSGGEEVPVSVPAAFTCGCRIVPIRHCCEQGADQLSRPALPQESHQSSLTLEPGLGRRRPR